MKIETSRRRPSREEKDARSRGKSREAHASPPRAKPRAAPSPREQGREGEQPARQRRGEPAALYLRVSTEEQSLENQRPELEQLAQGRGYDVVAVYDEKASAAGRRPEFARMLADAHRGRFRVLLIWAIDRFGRSMAGNLQAVLELDRRNVRVVSFRETWLDTEGPTRNLLVAVFSWVAEQERAQIAARTRTGLARARSKGVRLGRPPERFDVARARRMVAGGTSLRLTALTLGVAPSTLVRHLKKGTDHASKE